MKQLGKSIDSNFLIELIMLIANFYVFNCLLHRLYSCLRLAIGWIIWHIRKIDDGLFRRRACEALLVCYSLQALVILRAQFTDNQVIINWIAIFILTSLAAMYGSFRFGKGGNLIKVYELPSAAVLR
jgi:hypothetical protein